MGKGFFLSQDGDCHWYVVPKDKKKEWDEWRELDEDNKRSWEAPYFAIEIGGCPSQVIFKDFEIK